MDTWLGGAGTFRAFVVALGSVGAGVWLCVRLVRRRPRQWGNLAVVAGLALFAVPVVSTLLRAGPAVEASDAPTSWGWTVVVASFGLSVTGIQRAWCTWSRGDTFGKVLGAALASAATVAVLMAFEVLRSVLS